MADEKHQFLLSDILEFGPRDGHLKRGPYGDYLKSINASVGDTAWLRIINMEAVMADCILLAGMILPWEHSVERCRFEIAKATGMLSSPADDESSSVWLPDDDATADSWARRRG